MEHECKNENLASIRCRASTSVQRMQTAAAKTTARPNMLPETALALDFFSVGSAAASLVADVIAAADLVGTASDVEFADALAISKRICGRNALLEEDSSTLENVEVSSAKEVVDGFSFLDLVLGS